MPAAESAIEEHQTASDGPACYFSGYDCDSLAMESVTGFAERFVPFFAGRPDKWLELRTKSVNTSMLSGHDPVPNIITAFTMTPHQIAQEIEHGAPPFSKRLDRVKSLTQQGWMVGLRLDPLMPWPGFRELYPEMIDQIFSEVDGDRIHSVTLGPMRFPTSMYEKIVKLYPTDPLFALREMELREGQMTYPREIEEDLVGLVEERLSIYLPSDRVFRQLD